MDNLLISLADLRERKGVRRLLRKALSFVLALSIIFLAAPPLSRAGVPRTIRVGIAVTPDFKTVPNWRADFEKRLAYASRIFEGEFQLRFVPFKWYEWPTTVGREESHVMIEDLMSRFPLKDVDIMIGLARIPVVPKGPIRDPDVLGLARPFSGYLVLRYPQNRMYKIQEETALVHELAHLFGGVHTTDSASILYPVVDRQLPAQFDAENHEIITRTRTMDFRRGLGSLPSNVLQNLLGSYLKLAATDQPFDFYYSLGILYANLGQYDDAMSAWKKAASILPTQARIHYDLGMLYYRLGSQTESIRELMQCVQCARFRSENPQKVLALKTLGDIYMGQDNFVAAYQAYMRGIALEPEDTDLQTGLAIISMKKGQFADASREFEKILAKDPNNVKVLINIGIACAQMDRLTESERWLNKALPLAGKSSEVIEIHNALGRIYYKSNKQPQAIEHFRKACSMDMNVSCLKGLAQIHYELGQWDDCLQVLAKVLQIDKTDPDVYGTLATVVMQKGDAEGAIGLFREGLRYAKDNATAAKFYKNIGYILVQKQQYSPAEKEFQMAIAKDWNNAESYLGLSMVYLGLQDPVNAKEALKNVLRLDPKNNKAKEMLQSVEKVLKQTPQMDVQIQGPQ